MTQQRKFVVVGKQNLETTRRLRVDQLNYPELFLCVEKSWNCEAPGEQHDSFEARPRSDYDDTHTDGQRYMLTFYIYSGYHCC